MDDTSDQGRPQTRSIEHQIWIDAALQLDLCLLWNDFAARVWGPP